MKLLSPANITAFLVFSASAILNYFGSSPKILYLPAFALCVWVMYQTHAYVSYKEAAKTPEHQTIPAQKTKGMSNDRPNINISSQDQSGGFTGVNTGTVNLTPPQREITQEQGERLKQLLADTPRGRITMRFPITEAESGRFADKLCKQLRDLGFEVDNPYLASLTGYPNGLALLINPEDKESKMAFDLQNSLKAIGFPAPAYLETGVEKGTIEIQVGPAQQ